MGAVHRSFLDVFLVEMILMSWVPEKEGEGGEEEWGTSDEGPVLVASLDCF